MTTINTMEAPGEFDALVKLRPGEPYFTLLGHDPLAPALVLEWADANRKRGLKRHSEEEINDAKLLLELRQSTQAEEIAWAMKEYREGTAAAAAEEGKRATYQGKSNLPEEQQRIDAELRTRAEFARICNNAIAELTSAAEAMEKYDFDVAEQTKSTARYLETLSGRAKPARPALEKANG